jgi:RNA polymerase sigma factor (sigma-70 family)
MDWVRDAVSKRQFESFVAEASDPLLRTGFLTTGNVRDAEDLVQETFLRVARQWYRVRSMGHPSAYARRILIDLMLDDARRRSRRAAELGQQDAEIEAADESAAGALRKVDDLAEFRWALAQLPTRQRAVLVLRYWADLPVRTEIGFGFFHHNLVFIQNVIYTHAHTCTSTSSLPTP